MARLSGSCAAQSLTMLMAPEVETSDKSSAATDVAPSDDSVVVVRRVAEADLLGVGRKGFNGDGNEPCLVAARSFVPKPCAVQGASLETPNANEWNFLAKAILAAVVCDGFGEEVARQWGCFEQWNGRKAFRNNVPCPSRASGLLSNDAEAKATGGGDGGRWRWRREEATAMGGDRRRATRETTNDGRRAAGGGRRRRRQWRRTSGSRGEVEVEGRRRRRRWSGSLSESVVCSRNGRGAARSEARHQKVSEFRILKQCKPSKRRLFIRGNHFELAEHDFDSRYRV